MHRKLLPILILLLLGISNSYGSHKVEPGLAEKVRWLLEQRFEASEAATIGGVPIRLDYLRPFYEMRDYRPAWIDRNGLTKNADTLFNTVRQADVHGLRPADYNLVQILERLPEVTPEILAETDLLLTDAFLGYCMDLRSGRADPRNADPEWFLEANRIDHLESLEEALSEHNLAEIFGNLKPTNTRYDRLARALLEYRKIAAEGGWAEVDNRWLLRKGSAGSGVSELKDRLASTGDLNDVGHKGGVFDNSIEKAVKKFQRRHGLKTDGIVGSKTFRELNVPVAERIFQIILNMERWRWMPQKMENDYLVVNMAGFDLRVISNDVLTLEMPVIVGKNYRRTPAFVDKMTYMVFSPYWNVPRKIAVEDILPKAKKNPEYLTEKGIKIFRGWKADEPEVDPNSVEWDNYNERTFPYRFRQDPGPKNSLGRIKFMLPNKFSIYLHDTPHREQFNSEMRAFSSGCVRLSRPIELAEYLMAKNGKWNKERIETLIEKGERTLVALPDPMPVYLVYWTAWAEKDGTINFRSDVYGRDKLLRKSIKSG